MYSTSGVGYDIGFTSQQEGKSDVRITYAAITSRSDHTGITTVLLMDGSVRSISERIELHRWRALGTRDGGIAERE